MTDTTHLVPLIRDAARPLTGADDDYDALLDLIGDARFVLLGEASHGTHEFYRQRAQITKRLIQEKGFAAVAVEADWPEAYRINRYVRGAAGAATGIEALEDFKRFPLWMWRNADVLNFVGWLREHNDFLSANTPKVGFYGLDLYSLNASIEAVLAYLDKVDPDAAQRARYRYSCFEDFGEDPRSYGYAAAFGLDGSCESEVLTQLLELQRQRSEYARRDGRVAADELFYAEQNARLVKNAEAYYRAMFAGRDVSWNLRDQHMAETLEALSLHLNQQSPAKIAVWAHNSHLGDARATEMSERGELNVGQLVRERHPQAAFSIGFTTYTGTVTAASDWEAPAERKWVRPALAGSCEFLFHQTGLPAFCLALRGGESRLREALRRPYLERAIGVIYRPATERLSHYFFARLAEQFDAVLHFDETRAVEPLERTAEWEVGQIPETFPTGV